MILQVLYIRILCIMKTIYALSLTLLFAGTVFSQEAPVAQDNSQTRPLISRNACDSLSFPKENKAITRLYRFKNTRVLKELTFSAGRKGPKLA